jgi:hypothetical protein
MRPTLIQLPDHLHAQAQALARTTGRTLEEVLTEAVEQGLRSPRGRRSAPAADADNIWQSLTMPEDMTST